MNLVTIKLPSEVIYYVQIKLIMTIDTATYDNGNNDECGTPLSVNDCAEFAIMAPRATSSPLNIFIVVR